MFFWGGAVTTSFACESSCLFGRCSMLGGSLAGKMNVRWVVVVRCKSASALGDRTGLCGSSLMRVTSMHDIKSKRTYV